MLVINWTRPYDQLAPHYAVHSRMKQVIICGGRGSLGDNVRTEKLRARAKAVPLGGKRHRLGNRDRRTHHDV